MCYDELMRRSTVSKILSDHNGPARRFLYEFTSVHTAKNIEAWFRSLSRANLRELHVNFRLHGPRNQLHPLPPPVLLCAPTLVVARICYCHLPKEITPSLCFPLLKQLTLYDVSISEDVFDGVLSACHVLESLDLDSVADVGCFRISSPTLKSVRLCACFSRKGELVIVDTSCLERLLLPCPGAGGDAIVRIIRSPKLKILGHLSSHILGLEIANLVFKSLTPASLTNTISTVKVLALKFSVPDLNVVIDVLRCFPCLEKLYVTCRKFLNIPMKENLHRYDPTEPVKCLETHLQELVLKDYEGDEQDVLFAKFFVLNANVLKKIKFGVSESVSKGRVADQHRLLEMGTRASRNAQLEFIRLEFVRGTIGLDTHDLSVADPFTWYFCKGVDALSEESHRWSATCCLH